jgi:hypothetical protein
METGVQRFMGAGWDRADAEIYERHDRTAFGSDYGTKMSVSWDTPRRSTDRSRALLFTYARYN